MKSQEKNCPRNNDTGTWESDGWIGCYGRGVTRRATQFLVLVAAGLNSKAIAQRFCMSHESVNQRLNDARFHLSAKTRAELVAKAMTRGVIMPKEAERCA